MTQEYSDAFLDEHRYINVDDSFWYECVTEDFERICDILGIELDRGEPLFSGFCSQGDGASWTGDYRSTLWDHGRHKSVPTYDIAPAKIREYAPEDETLHRIADELCMLNRIYGPVYAVVKRHYGTKHVHDNTMDISAWEFVYEEDQEDEDHETPAEIAEHIETTLIELFRDLAVWLHRTLEQEHDYQTSDEAVAEALEANEMFEEEEEEA